MRMCVLVVVAAVALSGCGSASSVDVSRAEATSAPLELVPLSEISSSTAESEERDEVTSTSAPTAEQNVDDVEEATKGPSEVVTVEPEGEPVEPGAAAVPRDKKQQERFATYEQVALDFVAAYARPVAADEDSWWDTVKPLLSSRVREDYEQVDPATVTFTKATGPAVVVPVDAPSDLVMIVSVPTDAGDLQVEMETTPTGIYVTRLVLPVEEPAP